MTVQPTPHALLTHADTLLAVGLQYGLWVEASPSVEEQIALSSMSQDKLGHARAFYQLVEGAGGGRLVALQYDRSPEAFSWMLPWVAPLPTWEHLVLAQVLFGRALLRDVEAYAEGTGPHALLSKLEQEERWHVRHGDAWLRRAGTRPEAFEVALAELWPLAEAAFGPEGAERFPEDVASGARTADDETLREGYFAEVVPLLEGVGLSVPSKPVAPSAEAYEALAERVEERALELAALLQDPVGRAMAEL